MTDYLWHLVFWVFGFAGGFGVAWFLWHERRPSPPPSWTFMIPGASLEVEVDEEYTWTRPAPGATNADSEHPHA